MPEPRPMDHEVARAGLEAAAAVVERMLELGRTGLLRHPGADRPQPGGARGLRSVGRRPRRADSTPADLTKMSRRLRADAERLVELYADVDAGARRRGRQPRRAGDGARSPLQRPVRGRRFGSDLPRAARPPAPRRGSTCSTDLPDHRHGSTRPIWSPTTAIGSRASSSPPLRRCWTPRPAGPPPRSPSASRSRIAIRPGTYYGHLLADGLPEVVLPIVVEVVS